MKNRSLWRLGFLALCVWHTAPLLAEVAAPLDIGSRLEPLVDQFLIDQLGGDAKLELQKPTLREMVFQADKPWEGNTSAYFTIFADEGRFRMYYRGSHVDDKTRKSTHREVACYAESTDGIHWTKPNLGLCEFEGSKENNIVWDGQGAHAFVPFKDARPDCQADARYKALAPGKHEKKRGLLALQSADGLRWNLMRPEPVITKGAFDSQNLAFYDVHRGLYVDYHRVFSDKVRDIMTATSQDFLTWTEPVLLRYPGAPKEHLYTNAIRPYERAPHILLGFPTRYLNNKEQQVEPVFMTSRDGRVFQRWTEALIPVSAPQDRSGNRSNYMAWGMIRLPGQDKELSMYATEGYYRGPASRLRRATYRLDGFVALHAAATGGEMLTKPLRFAGAHLTLNYRTNAQGSLQVEIQDAAGKPLPGFALADCRELRGDAIDQTVAWKNGPDVSRLAGQTIRLRFALRDADLFALQFTAPPKVSRRAAVHSIVRQIRCADTKKPVPAAAKKPPAPAAKKPTAPPPKKELVWKAGVATAQITPKGSMTMSGYAARKKPSEGVEQDLFAKALVLEDAQKTRVVIITLDLIGVTPPLRDAVEKQVAEQHHLPPAHLLMGASHTHCGPEYRSTRPEAVEYQKFLEAALVRIVGEAITQLAPAEVAYNHARAGFAMNRRRNYQLPPTDVNYNKAPNPDGPVDHDVPVLAVTDAENNLRAVLFGYACHNTTLQYYLFCGDYAGYAQEYWQKDHPGATAMFLLGCGADQNPYPRSKVELAQQHGRTLATAIDAALFAGPRPIRAPLRCAYEKIPLKKSDDRPEPLAYPIQTISFGKELRLAALASEVTVDYSLRLKRELCADGPLWVVGYANGYFGYIPSDRVLKEGGYEAASWKQPIEETIVKKVHELLGR